MGEVDFALRCERPIRGTSTPATGTDAGYQRHWGARERPCDACAQAHSLRVIKGQKTRPAGHREANMRWRAANPGYFGRRQAARLQVDVNFRLTRILRKRLWGAVTSRTSKTVSVIDLVGCSIGELKAHLEVKFAGGMAWENYGAGGWEIDHVRPCASFDLTDLEQQRQCFHYTNLQPLWALDNRRKRDCLVRQAISDAADQRELGDPGEVEERSLEPGG